MRTTVKISIEAAAVVLALGIVVGRATPARAEAVYATPRGVLAAFFPKSERVTYQTLKVDAREKARLTRRLGYAPARSSYAIFVALTHGQVDGYAVIDDELGLHQPITFATRLSNRGVIDRVEIMVYRELRGDEVRDARFRQQFQGKTAEDPLRIDRDIDAVSGATVSSASLAKGVRRAAILVEELGLQAPSLAAAKLPVPGGAPLGLQAASSRTARP